MSSGPIRTATRGRRLLALLWAGAWIALAPACVRPSPIEIPRARAIDIARAHVSFAPEHVEAVRVSTADRNVWRVTLRGRLPGQPAGLFETAVVEVDRVTGEIVSVGRT